MLYLCNGLSEAMKRDSHMKSIPYPLSEEEFVTLINHSKFVSVIGHEDLAECLTRLTGKHIAYNRRGLTLNYEDEVIVVYLNGRLPEKPTFIQYKGRLNFSFIRFEKQSPEEMQESLNRIHEIIKIEEE